MKFLSRKNTIFFTKTEIFPTVKSLDYVNQRATETLRFYYKIFPLARMTKIVLFLKNQYFYVIRIDKKNNGKKHKRQLFIADHIIG